MAGWVSGNPTLTFSLGERDFNATMQKFPADEETVGMIPEASTNVWTLHLDRERGVFIYDLQRHGQPRYRAEFNMRPLEET